MTSSSRIRIGIDVGGTNTDAVLLDGNDVLATYKSATTEDVESGIVSAISEVLVASSTIADSVASVMIGTTQFTNAFVERRGLESVGAIRICLPAAAALEPYIGWPKEMIEALGGQFKMVSGGYQCDGRTNSELDELGISRAAKAFKKAGIRAIAITGLFAPLNRTMEERAEYIVRNTIPDARVTLSSAIGRLSLLERENATIMNASLAGLAEKTIGAFGAALCSLGVGCELYISQNDGTLMSADFAKQYPVLTFSSGPTNSIRGAAYLSKLDTALVADVGGTTTDVGILSRGFPRESSLATDIGGVRTNFRMPDIISLGIGGGSIVRVSGTACTVGPRSVGYRLTSDAMVFGGNTMTATDVAVAAGYADLGDSSLVKQIPRATVSAAVEKIHASVADTVDRMKTSNELLPMIIVGGGSILINRDIEGVSETVIPHWSEVANAVGASLAQVGGEVDRVYNYDDGGRAAAIEHATEEATDMAVRAGADKQQVTVIDFEEVPMAYMPGNAVRIRLRTAGPLAQSESEDRALD